MLRVRTKICGIRDLDTAMYCAQRGVDALGFVFVKSSPRYIAPKAASEIAAQLPAFVTSVALVMDQTTDEIQQILELFSPDLLQFHGNEPVDFCRQFSRPYIKAVPMGGGVDPLQFAQQYTDAQAVLIDSNAMGESGGSGHAFSWQNVPKFQQPVILAGGLRPDNVAQAIQTVQPYAVDVSSGVESERGKKDLNKISLFLKGVESV